MKYQDFYQIALIVFALLIFGGGSFFIYRELFPEYKAYQSAYVKLEEFRSEYSKENPAPFSKGIKQVLLASNGSGPEAIDRCVSCHVAVDLPHFSPTRVALDVNGRPLIDANGKPILEENPDYVWKRVEEEIATLTSEPILEELRLQGRTKEAAKRVSQAKKLSQLKNKEFEGRTIHVEKVIQMHPLIGSEMRPFEYHPLETYGCTCCHSGNGRSLVAKRAHGPVFDHEYEASFRGPKPLFTERDSENDPLFAKMYNDKPSHDLIFQTSPLLAGPLVEAKCAQCHQPLDAELESAIHKIGNIRGQKELQLREIKKGVEYDREALSALVHLYGLVEKEGQEGAALWLQNRLQDYHLSERELDAFEGQLNFLTQNEEIAVAIEKEVERLLGSEESAARLLNLAGKSSNVSQAIDSFLQEGGPGSLLAKQRALEAGKKTVSQFLKSTEPLALFNQEMGEKFNGQIDDMLTNYRRGKELFISQACYACHRINGYSRGSVGPELTFAGLNYPWYIKESIVWPQADLPSSTMPNFKLDHEELSALMTFLMAQKGESKAISDIDYQIKIRDWERGAKMPWERAVSPLDVQNVREGQKVFVSEGCASCHRLEGFDSSVCFTVDYVPQTPPAAKKAARDWFYKTFPASVSGKELAMRVESEQVMIEKNFTIRETPGILEEIETRFPGLLSSFYTNFKYAERAYNTAYAQDPAKLEAYKKRLHLVFMAYIQEYGLGREIAPPLNWSGVWRDDEWLLGHFRNPTAYTSKSLMPVMPFDDTKFFMLSHMLHALGVQNRDRQREIWQTGGFNPALAFQTLCASCHGEQRQGNGAVAEWIFPIPKNLRNPAFLSHLTKERAIHSIAHGIKGTPMPPWNDSYVEDKIPVLEYSEIMQLVDWLYQELPESERAGENEKWAYQPINLIWEMKKEKAFLEPISKGAKNYEQLVDDYFEQIKNPQPNGRPFYYIKEKYYTADNLESGQQLFEMNCAICHGNDGAGTGLRASTMFEAKPRVFTDIPWIRSEDDLFLLRSIKYGVPGTSMVAWGDQTSAEQRMQLAMYIRSLSSQALLREELKELTYDKFDRAILAIESARVRYFEKVFDSEGKIKALQLTLNALVEEKEAEPEKVGALYSELYAAEKEHGKVKEMDALYLSLVSSLKEEKIIYLSVGEQLIAAEPPKELLHLYYEIVQKDPLIYTWKGGELRIGRTPPNDSRLAYLIGALEEKIKAGEQSYINLRTKLVIQMANAEKLREKQLQIFEKL